MQTSIYQSETINNDVFTISFVNGSNFTFKTTVKFDATLTHNYVIGKAATPFLSLVQNKGLLIDIEQPLSVKIEMQGKTLSIDTDIKLKVSNKTQAQKFIVAVAKYLSAEMYNLQSDKLTDIFDKKAFTKDALKEIEYYKGTLNTFLN